jgi:hypothetical protein
MDTQKEKAKLDYDDIIEMCINFVVYMMYLGALIIVGIFVALFFNTVVAQVLFFTLIGVMLLMALVFFGYPLIIEIVILIYKLITGKKISGR